MKKLLLMGVLLVFGFTWAFAAEEKTVSVPFVDDGQTSNDGFVGWLPDQFVVQLTQAATVARLTNLQNQPNAATITSLPELDPLAVQFEVDQFQKEFVDAEVQPLGSAKPDLSGYFLVHFNRANLTEAMAAFAKNPLVDHVEPIGIHKVDFTPNDTYATPGQAFGYMWGLEQTADHDIDAFTAWDIQKGSTGVILADLDTGFRYYHKDLGGDGWLPAGGGPQATGTTGNIWLNTLDPVDGVDNDGNGFVDDHIGWDFVTGITGCAAGEDCSTADNDPRDFNGHGTHTGGTIAAITNNARGVAGVAGGNAGGLTTGIGNGCKLMCLRIGWSDAVGNGFVNMAFAAQALNYAAAINNNAAQTAKVAAASASWGSSNSGGIQAAYENAIAAGILFVKAAGNSNNSTADFLNGKGGDSTMSVAATDSFDVRASFSSFGTWVDVSAPGVDIISTYHVSSDPANDYVAKSSGTSMSTPHVAGLAGLLKSQDGSLTRSQISSLIKANTDNIDALNPGFVGLLGTGRINAQKALAAVAPPCNVVANFSGTPTSGCAPLAVNFTDLSTGPVTSWSWNFGDAGTSTAQNPSHTYAAAGTYTVSLTVTSATCSNTKTNTNYITVTTAPTAAFVGSPTSGNAPLTVNFTDQSTGGPTSWSWDFGDAGTSTAQNPSHIYTVAGTYSVTLTASNACGSNGFTRTNYITVTTPPAQQCDDFNDGDISNWGNSSGTWTATGGVMKGNSNTTNARRTSPFGSFTSTLLDCDVRMNTGQSQRKARIIWAYVDGSNYRFIEGDDVNNWWRIYERVGGSNTVRLTVNQTVNTAQWYHVTVTATSSGNVTLAVGGVTLGSFNFGSAPSGLVGCGFNRSNSDFDNFCVGVSTIAGFPPNRQLEAAARVTPRPEAFTLGQNYPNPFNPTTNIAFSLAAESHVELTVFNMLGQRVRTLVNEVRSDGSYVVIFDGHDDRGNTLSSGIYFYRMVAGNDIITKRMMFVK